MGTTHVRERGETEHQVHTELQNPAVIDDDVDRIVSGVNIIQLLILNGMIQWFIFPRDMIIPKANKYFLEKGGTPLGSTYEFYIIIDFIQKFHTFKILLCHL